jgi:hypothetical protein
MKICKCGKESKYARCNDCNKKYMAEYYAKNKEILLEKQKKHNEENKLLIKEKRKLLRQINKEKIAKQKHEDHLRHKVKNNLRTAKWYENNREHAIENSKKWVAENREKVREYKAQYDKLKAAESVEYRIKRSLRARLRAALQHNIKQGSSIKELGCSVEEFKKYFESLFYANRITGEVMTWENYGVGKNKWQIDHIKALVLFDLTDPIQFKQAVHYTNLQPLWYNDHVIKTKKDGRKHK